MNAVCRDCRWYEWFTAFENPRTCRCPYCAIEAQALPGTRVLDWNQPCRCGHFVLATDGQIDSYDKKYLMRDGPEGPDRLGTDGEDL